MAEFHFITFINKIVEYVCSHFNKIAQYVCNILYGLLMRVSRNYLIDLICLNVFLSCLRDHVHSAVKGTRSGSV